MEFSENIDDADTLIMCNSVDALYFSNNPHIHLHAVTTDTDINSGKDAVVEICCHICSTGIYVIFDSATMVANPDGHPFLRALKQDFIKAHNKCRDSSVVVNNVTVGSNDFYDLCDTVRKKTSTYSIKV